MLALGNISDRMEKGLSQQSREFMAGDRALRSSREVPQAWLEEAQKRGLKVEIAQVTTEAKISPIITHLTTISAC